MGRPRGDRIAVTGAADGLGALVLARLQQGAAREVVALGPASRPGDLSGVETVVHLATTYDVRLPPDERRARNVTGTADLLASASAAGVARVVLTTSAAVYATSAGGPVPLPEDAPMRTDPDRGLVGDHLEVERLAEEARRRGLQMTVLRPASLVGGSLGASYDAAVLRQLSASRLLAVRGVEPLWQLCHLEDLVTALVLAATGKVTGNATVACAGWLPQAEVERIAGRRRLELSAGVAMSTAERLHRSGLTAGSPRELDHLMAPVVVGAERLRAAGWRPTWTNEAALRAYLAQAPTGEGRSGAYSAAGATVALIGTAALVRRARRRRAR